MKIYSIIFILLVFFFSPAFAQEELKTFEGDDVKFKKEVVGGRHLFYHVLKKKKKVKHGPYLEKRYDLVSVKGNYRRGERVGKWQFFNLGEVFQEYDYDTESFSIRKTEFPGKSHVLIVDGAPVIDSLDVEATVVGGYKVINQHLYSNLRPFGKPYRNEDETIRAMVVVTETGLVQEIQYLDTPPKRLLQTFNRAFESARELTFFPAIKGGEPVKTGIILTLDYNIQGVERKKTTRWK